jgi:hypothetical protein
MKRALLAILLAVALAVPAFADVTIKSTTTSKAFGFSGKTPGTAYIKGNKMRSDAQMGNKTLTTVFDLDAQKMYSWESGKKEVDVWDMAAFAAEVGKSVNTAEIKASVKPNGQTKQFGSYTAQGYTMEISVPMAAGKEQNMNFVLTGPVWIVKNAPGAADYANFYKAAVEKGWIFTDPRAAKGQPGQAKAMAEMYRQFAEIGGVAFETDVQIKMDMGGQGGPMGGLLGRLGGLSFTSTVESVETGSLADDLFAPPAGYKLNNRK